MELTYTKFLVLCNFSRLLFTFSDMQFCMVLKRNLQIHLPATPFSTIQFLIVLKPQNSPLIKLHIRLQEDIAIGQLKMPCIYFLI